MKPDPLTEIIERNSIELLERMKVLDKDDRCALLLEIGEWIFIETDLKEELFLPDWIKEKVFRP
tara:strand:- start:338 stop:529 length:192 start_codon:yes stop_codon:yes gene_type:complete